MTDKKEKAKKDKDGGKKLTLSGKGTLSLKGKAGGAKTGVAVSR